MKNGLFAFSWFIFFVDVIFLRIYIVFSAAMCVNYYLRKVYLFAEKQVE